MRVVFWGSPAFAVETLDALRRSRHAVVGVVTRPPRPKGRGREPAPTPVARRAVALGIPVLDPRSPRDSAFLATLADLAPDVSVVAAYGAILPKEALDLPEHGSINVHASLLPAYRGAAPVTRALLDGVPVTGVTIMRMDEGLDTGPILLAEEVAVAPDDTAGGLTERLARAGARLAVVALDRLEEGALEATPQDDARATYASRVATGEAEIDWSWPAGRIERAARAFDPWPGAWTTWRGERLKVFRVAPRPAEDGGEDAGDLGPGTVVAVDPEPVVRAGDGAVALAQVQPAGGRRMPGAAWARGRSLAPGERLGGEPA